jgi:hypothetical protein
MNESQEEKKGQSQITFGDHIDIRAASQSCAQSPSCRWLSNFIIETESYRALAASAFSPEN